MTHQVEFRKEQAIIETVYTGNANILEVFAAIRENLALSKQYQTHRFLVDCCLLVDEKGKVFENYEVGTYLGKLIPEFPRGFREAMILPSSPTAAQNLRFFETVARNRGINVRVFDTREEALAWLSPAV